MLQHAHKVLGVPVVFSALVAWDRLALLPGTRRRLCTSTTASKDCAAMLMPAGGELFSIYVDSRQGMFVQAQDDDDALYVLDGRWGALRNVLPPDSSCLAVVYENRAGKLVLGVYDVLRVGGADKTRNGVFERQASICELFKRAPPLDSIEMHWVGLEESLLKYMQVSQNLAAVPFEVGSMLRLSSDSSTGCDTYQVVLRPLLLRTSAN